MKNWRVLFLLTFVLGFLSCDGLLTSLDEHSDNDNASSVVTLENGKKLITINAKMPGNQKSASFDFKTGELKYKLTANSFNEESIWAESNTSKIVIALELEKTYTLTVELFYNGNVVFKGIKPDVKILTLDETVVIPLSIYKEGEQKGSVNLTIGDAGTTVSTFSTFDWKLNTSNGDTVATNSTNCTLGAQVTVGDLTPGVYKLFLTFKNDDGDFVYYYQTSVNVFAGLTTETWQSGGKTYLEITDTLINSSLSTTLYVKGEGGVRFLTVDKLQMTTT